MFLVMWLTPKIWPIQAVQFPLFALVMIAPLMTIAALRLWANPRSLHPIRHEWRTASVPEAGILCRPVRMDAGPHPGAQ